MRRAIPILVVVVALGGLGLCREARAVVVGVDTDKSTASDNGATEPARAATTDPGHVADPGERLVDPFDNSPRSNMPETLPEDVVRRAAEHYNHQHNSRRFEQLLDRGADTPAVTRAATRETATRDAAPAAKHGHVLDYLVGLVIVIGIGLVALLRLRGRTTTWP